MVAAGSVCIGSSVSNGVVDASGPTGEPVAVGRERCLRALAPHQPRGEELRATTVCVTHGDLGSVYLVLACLAAHLERRLREADHPAGADGVAGQHAAA